MKTTGDSTVGLQDDGVAITGQEPYVYINADLNDPTSLPNYFEVGLGAVQYHGGNPPTTRFSPTDVRPCTGQPAGSC
ncbi:MAG TPA: hypothetical protein VNE62_03750 [Actinomycetota bacterium]|nr:hypothetical protein [Actinomycetota bacterium]